MLTFKLSNRALGRMGDTMPTRDERIREFHALGGSPIAWTGPPTVIPNPRLHAAILHELIAEDERLARQERHPNTYRIGHYLKALDAAEGAPDLLSGILDSFTHSRLRDRILRAAGFTPCGCSRAGSCRLCR